MCKLAPSLRLEMRSCFVFSRLRGFLIVFISIRPGFSFRLGEQLDSLNKELENPSDNVRRLVLRWPGEVGEGRLGRWRRFYGCGERLVWAMASSRISRGSLARVGGLENSTECGNAGGRATRCGLGRLWMPGKSGAVSKSAVKGTGNFKFQI